VTGERFVCIHAHLYQPPRENAWLEAIEAQDSARPFHDWNERVTAECYWPNAFSRILDGYRRVEKIVNNYERISFNVGPTLMSWLEAEAGDVHARIVEADRASRERFGGHGSAIAQAYNHMILPLANARDRATQVRWGVRDFQRRFGRDPEGFWLPETAVDLATLETLAEHGLKFTILAPRQAARVRRFGDEAWTDVHGEKVDTTRAYLQRLPSGRSIALFFYDGPVSRAVAFEGLLARGEDLAHRLLAIFLDDGDEPRLAHIASDGETYGHHHPQGEMALSYALQVIEEGDKARLVNYGQWLERFPPAWEVEIAESTSWSCDHGIERWRSDCGCNAGRDRGWKQAWRGPLREALDGLRDRAAELFERRGAERLREPWSARDAYVEVLLDRSRENVERFLSEHALDAASEEARVEALRLLELQRFSLLMYTSCGWFFDEISGLETVQVLEYAARAIQLAEQIDGTSLEPEFVEKLARAPSNLPERGDGAGVWRDLVKPQSVTLSWVGAHFAVSSLFESYGASARIFCYDVEREHERVHEVDGARLLVGRIRVASRITLESQQLSYAVLHLGAHSVHGGVRPFDGDEAYEKLQGELVAAFEMADLPGVVHLVDDAFSGSIHSLRSLFRDQRRAILARLLEQSLRDEAQVFRELFERQAPLLRFLVDIGAPPPKTFRSTAEFVLGSQLRDELDRDGLEAERIRRLVDEAARCGVELDGAELGYGARALLKRQVASIAEEPRDERRLARLENDVTALGALPFYVDLSHAQNLYWKLREELRPAMSEAAATDDAARSWLERFHGLGERLHVRVD
jgi:alpha-amylase/alpha-mannosidase (GH57 family)